MKYLETNKGVERDKEGVQVVQVRLEAQSNSSSSLPRPAGPFDAKKDAQDAYGLRFGLSPYSWKDNFITFPM